MPRSRSRSPGVHDPLHGGLVFPVDAALLQHLVHQVVLPWSTWAMIAMLRMFSVLRHKKVAHDLTAFSTVQSTTFVVKCNGFGEKRGIFQIWPKQSPLPTFTNC